MEETYFIRAVIASKFPSSCEVGCSSQNLASILVKLARIASPAVAGHC
jgi:hypothetical protein